QQAAPDVMMIPMTSGSEAIVYNLEGLSSGMWISQEVLADIYLGRITKWNDAKLTAINPSLSLPGEDIAVVHRSDGSATTNIFTNYLSKVSADWKSQVGSGNAVNWPGDTRVMLTNSSNPKAYPIVGFTWLLVYSSYGDSVKGKE